MNTLLLANGDITIICDHVTKIVLILAVCYMAKLFLQWLLRPHSPKDIIKPDDNGDKKLELELQRQDRVRALLKEIASISSDKIVYDETKEKKVYYEKYNDTEANKLWELYKKIGEFGKKETNNEHQTTQQ